jgi:hypothetical protein
MVQCGCMDEKSQCSRKLRFRHYYQWLFLQVARSHPPPLRGLEVHINGISGISIHTTSPKFISVISKPMISHYSSVILHVIPSLVHIIAKSSTFLVSSTFDITKLQKNCLEVSLTGTFPFPISVDTIFISLTIIKRWGLKLDLNVIESHYLSQCSRKLWFQPYYQRLLLQITLSHPHLYGC